MKIKKKNVIRFVKPSWPGGQKMHRDELIVMRGIEVVRIVQWWKKRAIRGEDDNGDKADKKRTSSGSSAETVNSVVEMISGVESPPADENPRVVANSSLNPGEVPFVRTRRIIRRKKFESVYGVDDGARWNFDLVHCDVPKFQERGIDVENLNESPVPTQPPEEPHPSPLTSIKNKRNQQFKWLTRWRFRRIQPEEESRVRQMDDGFFEKFGILLKQTNALAEEEEQRDRFNHAEAAAQVVPEIDEEEPATVTIGNRSGEVEETPEEQPQECPLIHSDSENEDISDIFDMAVGLNIEELYSEILYEILHNVGCDVSCEIGQTALFSYAQDAFKIPNDKHEEMLATVQKKEAPDVLLNVEIVEAKDLASKDSNGLSDPFVTLFLASDTTHRYNTSVKPETLNPVWEEHFALAVPTNVAEDTLCLEVWDFDPAETVREKLAKISEVKGVKGLRKLVKEIAVTCATGQHENELIGKASIPLKAIPASGMTMWYSLDKKNKITRQGVVKVNLGFSSEKNTMVAAQEYRHLIKLLLLHELELSKVCAYWWCGNFTPQAEALLTQHSAQSGLTSHTVALCQWATYTAVHADHPLSFALFSNLLEKLVRSIQMNGDSEDGRLFWDSAKKLLPSCFSLIRKIRKKCNDKSAMKQLIEVLKIIAKISTLQPPENFDLFPANNYSWIQDRGEGPYSDVSGALESAVNQGTSNWFDYIQVNNAIKEETHENKLQYLLKIIGLVRTDLLKAIEYYDKLFQEILNFQYAKTLYRLSEEKISALVKPEVISICKSVKRLTYEGEVDNKSANPESSEPLVVGTSLFELYLMLQRFITLGSGLSASGSDDYEINNFYMWFHNGVAHWLDIAVYKALQRIEKAVELDTLAPVDTTTQISSSAVDTLTIFYQVQVFWQQLNWPDVEGCYTFVAKIIDDICRCSVFYADKMSLKVDGLGDVQDMYEKRFEVTSGLCLAVNNIDYVRQSLQPFIEKLGMEELLQKLSDLRSPLESDRCRQTLTNVLDNAIDTVRNKIIELLEVVARKMTPAMRRLLVEGAELLHQDSNSVDRLMMYLDNNLAMLHEHLNEENFNQTLEVMWTNLGVILRELVQSNLDKRRPPSFFSNLHETLNLMVKSFKSSEEESSDCPALREIEELLQLNGLETVDLIHQVYLEQYRLQLNMNDSPYGKLTVRLQFQDNNLVIEVLNARDLMPMDSNGQCDSFIRIHFLPEEKFVNAVKPKTQTHNKNRFPLYDEVFTINLTPEQRNLKDGLVMFSVKDKDFLGMANQYMADAFVPFTQIPISTSSISSQPQKHLLLSRPHVLDSKAFKALEFRIGDKMAKEFAKRIRQKLSTTLS